MSEYSDDDYTAVQRHPDDPFESTNPSLEWECIYPGQCLCPHPQHQAWECVTLEDAEAQQEELEKEGVNG